ncbi:MAG: GreA/GreB family elongation factor [Nitriliruptoraceae bacterium]|nr:GreA/GreB family elongation factor [Nitriliruptoraceae bacterium]
MFGRSTVVADVSSPSTRTRPILTGVGRTWLQARHDRIAARLVDIEDELHSERTDQLVAEHQRLVEQIEALTQVLRNAVAPADVRDDPTIVEVGDEVEVRFPDGDTERFLIVHPVEAGMDEHRTSMDAPLAAAVLGRRPGDRVTVTSPAGVYHCTIERRTRLE